MRNCRIVALAAAVTIFLFLWCGGLGVVLASETRPPQPDTQLPKISLSPGQGCFSLDGQPSFLFSRNLTGKTREDFAALLAYARQGGTKLLRIHLTHGWWGDPWINRDWTVDQHLCGWTRCF